MIEKKHQQQHEGVGSGDAILTEDGAVVAVSEGMMIESTHLKLLLGASQEWRWDQSCCAMYTGLGNRVFTTAARKWQQQSHTHAHTHHAHERAGQASL